MMHSYDDRVEDYKNAMNPNIRRPRTSGSKLPQGFQKRVVHLLKGEQITRLLVGVYTTTTPQNWGKYPHAQKQDRPGGARGLLPVISSAIATALACAAQPRATPSVLFVLFLGLASPSKATLTTS